MTDHLMPVTVVPKLSGPKKQHVVPRFYLDGFCRDGLLSVYDRQKNEFRIQTPHNTGAITHYYTFTDAEGRRRYDLECSRRLNSDPPCRFNFDPGRTAAF
jgi:hypothetical protein